ncbi:unnamed protein product (macronuclear) [Paramecium tetraurelia]|uniref:HMG box domain-containing protein n=1 Tax=Paramecium tetraurelia TaxID=5888 RepID=A0DL85_PARTE|nr:uncharacterized protein GSPATT00018119001 [Paramecium tetraurelia]CAK83802.1 unnamed protein product [Paramecium tetraurelia]|eukprot:XP_001451199.1 hypothetical protein (macronuclear) [Paramecium tetraurelia strain d4-2]
MQLHSVIFQFKKLRLIQKKMEDVKADQSPTVIKYMMRRKSAEEVQAPLHDVEYNNQPKKKKILFFKSFQKVTIDPHIKLDEIKEEKWTIMTNNYKSLIEKSRQSLIKPYDGGQSVTSNKEPRKMQFLTRRQSIEFRLREIGTAPSNHSSASPIKLNTQPNAQQSIDPSYARFKKFYQKIGIPSDSPIKLKLQTVMSTPIAPPKKMDKSQHSANSPNQSPSPLKSKILHIKANNHIQYLKEIREICQIASNYHAQVKQDEKNQIQHASQQVGYIQAEFNKFHNMLTSDLETVDFIDENK